MAHERMYSCVSVPDPRALERLSAEEGVPTARSDKDLDGDLDSEEVFLNDTSEGKRKRIEREDVETVSPVKKKAKNPGTAHLKRPTRSVNNKKILKAKRTAVHVNRGKIEENCIVCVRENPTEEAYVGVTRKNGHVWFSLCEEFFEVLEDRKVMEEVREVVMRAKTKKDNEKEKEKEKENEKEVSADDCGICNEKLKRSQFSLVCVRCNRWIHLKCTQYTTGKEAQKKTKNFPM